MAIIVQRGKAAGNSIGISIAMVGVAMSTPVLIVEELHTLYPIATRQRIKGGTTIKEKEVLGKAKTIRTNLHPVNIAQRNK